MSSLNLSVIIRYLLVCTTLSIDIMFYAVDFRSESKKGYLHWKKKDLERALRSSKTGFLPTCRPYFVKRL